MIGDLDHATFSNVEHLSLDFVKYSLDPSACPGIGAVLENSFSDSEKGQYFVKFNVERTFCVAVTASRMQGYATARQNGWMSGK